MNPSLIVPVSGPPLSPRAFYIDTARFVACVLVVASHVFAPICAAMNDYPRSVWWIFNVFDSIIRPSAAIYVMISGKLFLGSSRDDSWGRFVWKRYAKLFPPFFVWSMIYAFYECRVGGAPFAWWPAIGQFLRGPTEYHLWFMYMILGLYLLMPFLRRFVRSAASGRLVGLLALWAAYLLWQFFRPPASAFGPLSTVVSYGGYAVLGYALDRANFERKAAPWAVLWVLIVLFNAVSTYGLVVHQGGVMSDRFYYGAAPLVALQAAAMFILLKRIGRGFPLFRYSKVRTMVTRVSLHSYNVYLNHALFIWMLTRGHLGFTISEHTGPNALFGVVVTTGLVMVISVGFSQAVQQVPMLASLIVILPKQPAGETRLPLPSPDRALSA